MKIGLCGFTIGAAAYYKAFEVVEVQQTFYDPPPATTLERWRTQAPADFEVTMRITPAIERTRRDAHSPRSVTVSRQRRLQ